MAFKNTPKELRKDNKTPWDLERIGDYISMAEEEEFNAELLYENNPSIRNQKYFIAAGCHVIQRPPRNLSNDPDEIQSQIAETSEELADVIKQLRKKRIKFKIKPPNVGKIDKNGFSIKSRERLESKAAEYALEEFEERPYSRVVDTVRTTLSVDTAHDLQRLSEFFRPCAMPNVIRYINSLNQPSYSPIRRIHIIARSKTGLAYEIQARNSLADAFYDASELSQRKERHVNQQLGANSGKDEIIRKLEKISLSASRQRELKNQLAASLQEVSVLQFNHEFLTVDGFPVVINHDSWEGQTFALVPNPVKGLWETDQRFLDLIYSGDVEKQEATLREISIKAEALNQTNEIRQILSLG